MLEKQRQVKLASPIHQGSIIITQWAEVYCIGCCHSDGCMGGIDLIPIGEFLTVRAVYSRTEWQNSTVNVG
jgi:hypothetical protein